MTMLMAGCTGETGQGVPGPDYRASQVERLSDELIRVTVAVDDASEAADVTAYADCVASNFALTGAFAFARHVRTNLSLEGSLWQADAVYTLSMAIPPGLRTIDAQTKTAACIEAGIPTV